MRMLKAHIGRYQQAHDLTGTQVDVRIISNSRWSSRSEIYQERMKEIKAADQLVSEGCEFLLQHMHPATVLIIAWAIIRATAAPNPRPKAGLSGYEHVPGAGVCTSDACKMVISCYGKYHIRPTSIKWQYVNKYIDTLWQAIYLSWLSHYKHINQKLFDTKIVYRNIHT